MTTGAVTQINYGSFGKVTYAYDIAGRMTEVGTQSDSDAFAAYSYDSNGNLYQEKLNNNGVTRTYSYNGLGALTEVDDSFFKETIQYETGGYGSYSNYTGLITKITYEMKHGPYSTTSDYNTTFEYDKLGRMIVADNSGSSSWDVGEGTGKETTYDANGNLLTFRWGATDKAYAYYDNTNKVKNTDGAGSDYTYDDIGNMITNSPKGLNTIDYDPYFIMTSKIDRGSNDYTNFQYGAAGQRVFKEDFDNSSSVRRTYYIHGSNDYPLIEKLDEPSGTTDIYYVYGLNGMIMQQIGTDKQFFIKDNVGSTKVVFDENNSFVSSFDYMPHGHLIRSSIGSEMTYRYTGQEYDEENSLHNFRARMYDSNLMGFLGIDPAGQFASPYTAMGNNPVMMVDPDGEFAVLIGLGVGLISGLTSGISNGQTGLDLLRTTLNGAIIGTISGAIGAGVGNIASASFNGISSSAMAGTSAGFVAGGFSSGINGGDFLEGALKGEVSGGVGGGLAQAITGGLGAFVGGASGAVVNTALNDGSLSDIATSALIGGGFAFGTYHLVSYSSYKNSSYKENISYKEHLRISKVWQKTVNTRMHKNKGAEYGYKSNGKKWTSIKRGEYEIEINGVAVKRKRIFGRDRYKLYKNTRYYHHIKWDIKVGEYELSVHSHIPPNNYGSFSVDPGDISTQQNYQIKHAVLVTDSGVYYRALNGNIEYVGSLRDIVISNPLGLY